MATNLPLKYVHRFRDRHGKTRHYFRPPSTAPSGRQVPLPGLPGSSDFMAAYQRALAEYEASAPGQTEIGATRARPGSVAAAVALYLASRTYGELAPATKNDRRCV